MKRVLAFILIAILFSACRSFYKLTPNSGFNLEDASEGDGSLDVINTKDISGPDSGTIDIVSHDVSIPTKTEISGHINVPQNLKTDYKNIKVLLIADLKTNGADIVQITKPDEHFNYVFRNFPYGSYNIFAGHFARKGLSVFADAMGSYGDISQPKLATVTKDKPVLKNIDIKLNPQKGTSGRYAIKGKVTIDNPDINPFDVVIFLSDNPELGKSSWYMLTILDTEGNFSVEGLAKGTYYIKAYALAGGDIKNRVGYGFYNDGMFPKAIKLSEQQPLVTDVNFEIYNYIQSPYLITGQITNPIPGQTYVLFMKDPFPVPGRSVMDFTSAKDDGSFLEITLPKQKYYVYAYHFKDLDHVCPDCYDAFGYYASPDGFPAAVDLTKKSQMGLKLTLSSYKKGPGVICGRVIYGQEIQANPDMTRVFASSMPAGQEGLPVAWGKVDQDGYFCLRNLPLNSKLYVYAVMFKDFESGDRVAFGEYRDIESGLAVPITLNEHRIEFDGAIIELEKIVNTPYSVDIKTSGDSKGVKVVISPTAVPDYSSAIAVGVLNAQGEAHLKSLNFRYGYVFLIGNGKFGYWPGKGLPQQVDFSKNPQLNIAINQIKTGKCHLNIKTSTDAKLWYLFNGDFKGINKSSIIAAAGIGSDGKLIFDNLACDRYLPIGFDFSNGNPGLAQNFVAMPVDDGVLTSVDSVRDDTETDISGGSMQEGDGTIMVTLDNYQTWKDYRIVVALYPSVFNWDGMPYGVPNSPDENGVVSFDNQPDGKWYVYAFAYKNAPVSGVRFDATGVYGVKGIPLPVVIDSQHKVQQIDLQLKKQLVGQGIITGHITNIGHGLNYINEAVFLTKTMIQSGKDPKDSAVFVATVSSDGNYIFKHIPDGTYYVYCGHYSGGNFEERPDHVGFYTTNSHSPTSIKLRDGSRDYANIDIVMKLR